MRAAGSYVTEAVLRFYLLHEPVIVAAAWFVVRWQVPVPAKYALLVVVSLAGRLALYEVLIRRFRVPRVPIRHERTTHPDGTARRKVN